MRSALFLTIWVCAACAKIEEFDPPLPSFTIAQNPDTGETRVTGALYEMHFSGGGPQAMHFPDQLSLSNSPNLLGRELACNNEQTVGLAMFPAFVTAPALAMAPQVTIPASTDDVDRNSISLNDPGPHVVQIGLRYTIEYTCPANERFEGRTAFTFYPSGRIVRHDFDVIPSINEITANNQNCGCGNATLGPLAFTTYWTFDDVGGRIAQRDGTPITFDIAQPEPDPPAQQNAPFPGLCTIYPDHAIGVSHAGGTSRIRHNANNFAHVFDFNFDPMLEPFPGPNADVRYDNTSAIILDPRGGLNDSDCDSLLGALAEPAITVENRPVPFADADGVYNDFETHGQAFDVITAVESLPPGWALRTTINSGVVKVTRDPPLDDDRPVALLQRQSNDQNLFLFYFPDGLAPGETITIEPL